MVVVAREGPQHRLRLAVALRGQGGSGTGRSAPPRLAWTTAARAAKTRPCSSQAASGSPKGGGRASDPSGNSRGMHSRRDRRPSRPSHSSRSALGGELRGARRAGGQREDLAAGRGGALEARAQRAVAGALRAQGGQVGAEEQCAVTPRTSMTARLVARNRMMRFIRSSVGSYGFDSANIRVLRYLKKRIKMDEQFVKMELIASSHA